MTKIQKEDTLDELWRIKREIGERYPVWEEYVRALLDFEEKECRDGVRFVSFASPSGKANAPAPI